ncbi:hypothetical protein [Staphylococcus hominis]|uniref:hypothetical protein n=1 Tax=Staphylococcus hominis TaxID=1290 RepID=UPI0012DF2DFE|nr:hypothetical protein [Staphylococcus hominis]QGR76857.1 hypothetical protein FOC55_02745 [Staphylococcus hominis]
MITVLKMKGFEWLKNNLHRWIDNLSKEEEQIYMCVRELILNLEEIKGIFNEVRDLSINDKEKIEKAIEEIDKFFKHKWISNVKEEQTKASICMINRKLKSEKSEILNVVKNIEDIIKGIPKYDEIDLEKELE